MLYASEYPRRFLNSLATPFGILQKVCEKFYNINTLPKFNKKKAPEKLPSYPIGSRIVFLSHHFSGVNSLLNFGGASACVSCYDSKTAKEPRHQDTKNTRSSQECFLQASPDSTTSGGLNVVVLGGACRGWKNGPVQVALFGFTGIRHELKKLKHKQERPSGKEVDVEIVQCRIAICRPSNSVTFPWSNVWFLELTSTTDTHMKLLDQLLSQILFWHRMAKHNISLWFCFFPWCSRGMSWKENF